MEKLKLIIKYEQNLNNSHASNNINYDIRQSCLKVLTRYDFGKLMILDLSRSGLIEEHIDVLLISEDSFPVLE